MRPNLRVYWQNNKGRIAARSWVTLGVEVDQASDYDHG
jgi:hypothetical protein